MISTNTTCSPGMAMRWRGLQFRLKFSTWIEAIRAGARPQDYCNAMSEAVTDALAGMWIGNSAVYNKGHQWYRIMTRHREPLCSGSGSASVVSMKDLTKSILRNLAEDPGAKRFTRDACTRLADTKRGLFFSGAGHIEAGPGETRVGDAIAILRGDLGAFGPALQLFAGGWWCRRRLRNRGAGFCMRAGELNGQQRFCSWAGR